MEGSPVLGRQGWAQHHPAHFSIHPRRLRALTKHCKKTMTTALQKRPARQDDYKDWACLTRICIGKYRWGFKIVSTLNARCSKYSVLKRDKRIKQETASTLSIGSTELSNLRAETRLCQYHSQQCYNSAGIIRSEPSGNANFQQSLVSLECSQCLRQIPDILTSC